MSCLFHIKSQVMMIHMEKFPRRRNYHLTGESSLTCCVNTLALYSQISQLDRLMLLRKLTPVMFMVMFMFMFMFMVMVMVMI